MPNSQYQILSRKRSRRQSHMRQGHLGWAPPCPPSLSLPAQVNQVIRLLDELCDDFPPGVFSGRSCRLPGRLLLVSGLPDQLRH